ncbi:hypothetical protein [Haliscomenobacter hydrossis]|uniref:YhcG N-terminal domain-containing protein n=1 Tax=Haliscomenobacter hydrossis (strain ATCC 27775 / DSM 1100 / LMG 10767 / O) TaxID=760192 RepID=F4L7W7_HALH1|nr:hypothetical protein [Haliscomenobacter hydrossis]AEE54475.1 hypothetical protein Halhy_6659 [Haliscomenobacter hydrossis DSM 1100]
MKLDPKLHILVPQIREIVLKAREQAFRESNGILLQRYWQIGLVFPILDALRQEYSRSRYRLYLPDEATLKALIERDRALFESTENP